MVEDHSPFRSDRVKLVEEHNTRFRRTRPLEQIPNSLLTRPDVLVEDLGTFDGDKIEAALLGDGRSE